VSFEEKSDGVLDNVLAADVSLQVGGTSYGICTVINHIGSLASCGHYAKQIYNITKREWMRFNDSNASKISNTILDEIEPY
jgi:ubiquitin C-terminal hydrolase